MAAFIDWDKRGLYSINDLTEAEVEALWNAIDVATLPDKRVLHHLKKELDGALVPF